MKITIKKTLLLSAVAALSLGFTSKVVFDHNSKVSANGQAQFGTGVKVTKFDEGLKSVRGKLPVSLKNKIKMPKSFPFQLNKIAASSVDVGAKTAYEERYIGKNGEILTLKVQEGPVEIDYSNNFGEKPVNVTLKDGTKAVFFKNHGSVSLNWVDTKTGLQYMMSMLRVKHVTDNELKNEMNSYHIDQLQSVEESLNNIN